MTQDRQQAAQQADGGLTRRLCAGLTPLEQAAGQYRSWPAPSALAGAAAEGLTPAAVLVPVVDHPGAPTLLMTIRTEGLQHHPGQISFPGGRAESDDADPVATALRESNEELGLEPEAVRVLGYLDAHCTVTGFCIAPVVGLLPPGLSLRPDPLEVAEVLEVPLEFLLNPANCAQKEVEYEGRARSYFVYRYRERVIWGATARIVVNMCRKMQSELETARSADAVRKNCELE